MKVIQNRYTQARTRGIICSMSRRGNYHDNAVMESFFSSLTFELRERFDCHGTAKRELFDDIEVFYNQRRRHSTLGQISPAEYERRLVAAPVDAAAHSHRHHRCTTTI